MTFKGGGRDTHKCLSPRCRFDTRSGIFAPLAPRQSTSQARDHAGGSTGPARSGELQRPRHEGDNALLPLTDEPQPIPRRGSLPSFRRPWAIKRFNPVHMPENAGFPANSRRRCLLSDRFGDISRGFILLERHMGLNASRVWLDRELAACGNSRRKNCLAIDAGADRQLTPPRLQGSRGGTARLAWTREGAADRPMWVELAACSPTMPQLT